MNNRQKNPDEKSDIKVKASSTINEKKAVDAFGEKAEGPVKKTAEINKTLATLELNISEGIQISYGINPTLDSNASLFATISPALHVLGNIAPPLRAVLVAISTLLSFARGIHEGKQSKKEIGFNLTTGLILTGIFTTIIFLPAIAPFCLIAAIGITLFKDSIELHKLRMTIKEIEERATEQLSLKLLLEKRRKLRAIVEIVNAAVNNEGLRKSHEETIALIKGCSLDIKQVGNLDFDNYQKKLSEELARIEVQLNEEICQKSNSLDIFVDKENFEENENYFIDHYIENQLNTQILKDQTALRLTKKNRNDKIALIVTGFMTLIGAALLPTPLMPIGVFILGASVISSIAYMGIANTVYNDKELTRHENDHIKLRDLEKLILEQDKILNITQEIENLTKQRTLLCDKIALLQERKELAIYQHNSELVKSKKTHENQENSMIIPENNQTTIFTAQMAKFDLEIKNLIFEIDDLNETIAEKDKIAKKDKTIENQPTALNEEKTNEQKRLDGIERLSKELYLNTASYEDIKFLLPLRIRDNKNQIKEVVEQQKRCIAGLMATATFVIGLGLLFTPLALLGLGLMITSPVAYLCYHFRKKIGHAIHIKQASAGLKGILQRRNATTSTPKNSLQASQRLVNKTKQPGWEKDINPSPNLSLVENSIFRPDRGSAAAPQLPQNKMLLKAII